MTVDIRRKEPISFEWQRLVRPNFGAPKPKLKKGFGGSIASMSKPEMYGRFRGLLDLQKCRVTVGNGS